VIRCYNSFLLVSVVCLPFNHIFKSKNNDSIIYPLFNQSRYFYTKNEEDHLNILKQVFTIIKQSGLMTNPDKCAFGTRRFKFLGHTISNKGVETNDDKIKKIMQAPSPGCITQLRSFLGLSNYYRRFIKDYALITAPLYAMLSEKEKKIH